VDALSVEARYLEAEVPLELDQTYLATFGRLKRWFRARGCTPEEAADLAQDAAIRAYVHIRRWGVTGDGLDPLINRIARNLLIDRYRRGTPYLVSLEDAAEVHDPEQDPTEEVDRRQRRRAVRHAVASLPDRHKTAILYSLNGMSPAEVGQKMGIGRNAADALLHRARRSLAERLRHVGEGSFGIAAIGWFKLRAAARRLSPARGGEAAAAGLMQAGVVVAAAALVAAFNVASPGGATSISPTGGAGRTAVAPAGAAGDSGKIGPASGSLAGGSDGRSVSVDLPGGGGFTYGGDRIHGDKSVPSPQDPDRELLGIAPDVAHEHNNDMGPAAPYVQQTERQTCDAGGSACDRLYEPIYPGF
jgi:RNA polymerase sigma-70 factor (ECF subfamily)